MKSCEIGDTLYVSLLLVLCYVWVVAPPQTKWSLTVYKKMNAHFGWCENLQTSTRTRQQQKGKRKKPRKRGRINKTVIKINLKKQEEIQFKCSVSLLSVFSWTWWWTRKEEEDLANRKGKEEEIKMDGRQWKKKQRTASKHVTVKSRCFFRGPSLATSPSSELVTARYIQCNIIKTLPKFIHFTRPTVFSPLLHVYLRLLVYLFFSRLLLLLPFCFVLIAFSVVAVGPRKYQRDRKRLLRGGSTW